jgi:Na+/melibiose symporter-like transporter
MSPGEAPMSTISGSRNAADTARTFAPPKVSFFTKIAYGLGAIPFGIKDQGFQTLLLLYYNQVLGLPAVVASTALLIALLVDAVADPVIGQISDTWRSKRFGRRHPFIYASVIPIAFTYFAIWNPPELSQQNLFIYLTVCAIAVRISLSLYEIPNLAMLPEITADYDQRTALGSYRTFFAVSGGLGMTLLAFMVFLKPTPAYPLGQLNPDGYFAYSIAAALLMAALVLISALGTHRLIASFRMPDARALSLAQTVREMIQSLSNRSLLVILAAGVCSGIGFGVIGGLQIYVSTYYWELSAAEIGSLSIANVGGVILAVLIATPLSRAIGKKPACLLSFLTAVLVGITPALLREAGLAPPNHTDALLALLMFERVFGAASGIAAGIVGASMVADIVEDMEVKTGRRSEGLLTSANAFVAKAVSGVGVFFAGVAISVVDFPANARPGEVAPEILTDLVLGYIFVVVVSLGASMLCLLGYSVSRESHAENLRRLSDAPG